MFFDQIVHKYIRPNVSPHQTDRTNVALAGRAKKHPAGFGESASQKGGGDHSSPATDFTTVMFHKTDLKTRIHLGLFWDLCCVTLALKKSFVNILGKIGFSPISSYFTIYVHILIC